MKDKNKAKNMHQKVKKKLKLKIISILISILAPAILVIAITYSAAGVFQSYFSSDLIDENLEKEDNIKLKETLLNKIEESNNYNTFTEGGRRIGTLSDYYGTDKRFKLNYAYVQAYMKYSQLSNIDGDLENQFNKTTLRIDTVLKELKPRFVYRDDKITTVRTYTVEKEVEVDHEVEEVDLVTKQKKKVTKTTTEKRKTTKTDKSEQNIYVLIRAENIRNTFNITYRTETTTTSSGEDTTTVTKPVIDSFKQEGNEYDNLKKVILKRWPDEDTNQAIDGIITIAKNILNEPISKDMFYTGSGNFAGVGENFTGSQQEFIEKVSKGAVEAYKEYNILPSITIAQAILESGWGASGLTKKANNLFGVKAFNDWTGPYVEMVTTEYDSPSGSYNPICKFRAYTSWEESIKDHSKVLMQNNFAAVRSASNYVEAAKALKAGGYATDPNYDTVVISFIQMYRLNQYDSLGN